MVSKDWRHAYFIVEKHRLRRGHNLTSVASHSSGTLITRLETEFTYNIEKKVENKAPITKVKIDNISINKKQNTKKNKKFSIIVGVFYSEISTNELKEKTTDKTTNNIALFLNIPKTMKAIEIKRHSD